MTDDNEILELARRPRAGTWGRTGSPGTRYVRTPEGSDKYGLPIGAKITRDAQLRAQRKGRSYSVPEDDSAFGSQPPAAGRTTKDAKEFVSAIKSSPTPKIAKPDGPKKVAVGKAGYGFPEGSRTFRPKDHPNFAIVRTPDYQLVAITDKGLALELEGELEKELNAELDDDLSEHYTADDPPDPNALSDVDGDGQTGQAADPAAAPLPARVEDMPGFLDQKKLDAIIAGMKAAGLDQSALDAAELQLHRNNNAIRAEFEAASAAPDPNAPDPNAPEPTQSAMETASVPVPDRQPDLETDPKKIKADIEAEAQMGIGGRNDPVLRDKAKRDEMYANPVDGKGKPVSEKKPEKREPIKELRDLEELSKNRPSGVAEGTVAGSKTRVRRNRVSGASEYEIEDDNGKVTPAKDSQGALDAATGAAAKRAAADKQKSIDSAGPRDTTGLAPSELTDKELKSLIADLDDFISTTGGTRVALRRRTEMKAEQEKRKNADVAEFAGGLDSIPKPAAEPKKPAADDSADDYNALPTRANILEARPGDRFTLNGKKWSVTEDGSFSSSPDADPFTREEFADFLDDPDVNIRASDSNATNKTPHAPAKPGDTATPAWAKEAPSGAVAVSGEGLVQTKQDDGTFETPIGPVDADTFKASDIEGDDSTVVRVEPTTDGRPVGATKQILSDADIAAIPMGDGIALVAGGATWPGRRLSDGRFELDLPGGLHAYADEKDILTTTGELWHVPNKSLKGKPSQDSWAVGDTLKSLDDLLAQTPGTKLRYQYIRPLRGKTESSYTVLPDGEVQSDVGTILPSSRIEKAVTNGQVSVAEIAPKSAPSFVPPAPAPAVKNLASYKDGDKISDYRHLKNMKPGQTVTLTVPAHQNGGQEAKITLTRTDDDKVMGGFMFLVGKRGRGYNSFGENNASLFQAIADGRLYYGDITGSPDDGGTTPLSGAWDSNATIEAWPGGPMVSQADLNEFINSQVLSPAMQTSYYDTAQIPLGNPFRQKMFRDEFAERAMKEFNEPGNPLRHKPASIKYAAQLLGLKYTDPGSTLIPDDLDLADFKKKITVGKWLRSTGSPTTPAETNMGPEQIDVTAADLKTAFAAMEAMLERNDSTEDPDVILKRIFARQGSPLQSLNTSVAIASYYGMRRYRINPDGSETLMTTIARQHDKRTNKELLRNMLREQLEGRPPGYYGLPKDERFRKRANGPEFVNRTTLTRPTPNSDTPAATPATPPAQQVGSVDFNVDATPAAPPAPTPDNALSTTRPGSTDRIRPAADGGIAPPPARVPGTTRDGRSFSTLSDAEMQDYADMLSEEANLRSMARDPLDADEQAELDEARAEAQNRLANPTSIPETNDGADTIFGLPPADDDEGAVDDADDSGDDTSTTPPAQDQTKRTPAHYDRAYVYDRVLPRGARQDVFELGQNFEKDFLDLHKKWNPNSTLTSADLQGKRMFATRNGSALGLLDGDTITDLSFNPKDKYGLANLVPTMVGRGGRVAVLADVDRTSQAMSVLGFRAQSFAMPPTGPAKIAFTLNPDYIGQKPVSPDVNMPSLQTQGAIDKARQSFADYEKQDFHMAANKGRAGDGWFPGTKLWGQYGASGVVIRHNDTAKGEERFLLVQRAGANPQSKLYGKWQLPGGGLDKNETDAQGAARETIEEINPPEHVLGTLKKVGENRFDDKSGWHYTNLTADIPEQFTPKFLDPREILDTKWLTRAEIAQMEANGELHPALSKSIRKTLATYGGTEADALPTIAKPPAPVTRGSISDPGAKSVPGTRAGTNGGQMYDIPTSDGSSERYFVKNVKNVDQGRQEAAAADLFRLAGAKAPEVEYDRKDHKVYSKAMDLHSRGPANTQALVREHFAAAAWLANWDVRLGDNIMFDKNNDPVFLDNGGSMEYRATANAKKPFGKDVPELDTLRRPGNIGSHTFGAKYGGADEPWEAKSAQKVVDISDADIQAIVKKHELPDSLAKTLIARRDTIAKRYKLKPTPAPAPAPAPAAPETPAQVADSVLQSQLRSTANIDMEKLTQHPAGMLPVTGEAYKETNLDTGSERFVAITKTPAARARTAAVTSALYRELGVGAVDVTYDAQADEMKTILREGGGNLNTADFRAGFVADAWLANHSAPTRHAAAPDGSAFRSDLRGSLELRLNGKTKNNFGPTVSEIDSLRNPAISREGAALYGQRVNGAVDAFEYDGAQKIVDLSDARITELVTMNGGDPKLAQTLIARRNDIASQYGLSPSGSTPPTIGVDRERAIDAAPSLQDARNVAGADKGVYVRANVPGGTDYLGFLKTRGGVAKAFDDVWKGKNPTKPEFVRGAKISDTALLGRATADQIIDLAAKFDYSPALLAAKAREMHSNVNDPRVLHEVLAEQRGWHEANAPVSVSELEAKIARGQSHVFRTVNPHSGMSGIQAADKYKEDGFWRRGTGSKAHGEGIYVSPSLDSSMGYGNSPSSGVIEMAFDRNGSKLTSRREVGTAYGNTEFRMMVQRMEQRKDLTPDQKNNLRRVFADAGTAALVMGYDALHGNGSTKDFNVLNKTKVTFTDQRALTKAEITANSRSASNYYTRLTNGAAYRQAQRAVLQPNLQKSNNAQGNTPPAAPTPATPAATPPANLNNMPSLLYPPGTIVHHTLLRVLNDGSIVSVQVGGNTLQLRKTPRGWINTATNRQQKWVDQLTSRSRKNFTIVLAT